MRYVKYSYASLAGPIRCELLESAELPAVVTLPGNYAFFIVADRECLRRLRDAAAWAPTPDMVEELKTCADELERLLDQEGA